jgi:hypothetical protein
LFASNPAGSTYAIEITISIFWAKTYIPEDTTDYNQGCENLESYNYGHIHKGRMKYENKVAVRVQGSNR